MFSDPPPGHQMYQYGFAPLQISGLMPILATSSLSFRPAAVYGYAFSRGLSFFDYR